MANTYKLGNFRFRWMSLPPDLPGMQSHQIVRPGVDNFAIFLTGTRADEFELETRRDMLHPDLAFAEFEAYKNLQGQIVTLEYAGQTPVAAGAKYLVIGVRPARIGRIKAGVGGVTGAAGFSRGTVEVYWRLRPVRV